MTHETHHMHRGWLASRKSAAVLLAVIALAGGAVYLGQALLNVNLIEKGSVVSSKILSRLTGPKVGLPSIPPTGYGAAPAAAPARGPLRVNPANRRYFSDGSGKAVLLAGDHTWNTLIDSGPANPPAPFNYPAFLDFLQANQANFFRMFVWEQAKWSEGTTTPYYYFPSPFQRTGPGNALDGAQKFDLTKFNQAYFDRLRQRVSQANDRGIYVAIQLFQGFSTQVKPFGAQNNPWPGHPLNGNNNINGINGDTNGDGQGEDSETLVDPKVTAIQMAYVDKVIDSVNDLNNVLFEICNECQSGSIAWQEQIIQHIHAYEAGKPKQHPVGMTVNWPGGSNQQIFSSSADWVEPNAEGGYFDNPPANNGPKVIVNDTDHLFYPAGDRSWMWKSFTRGLNIAFMDPYDCSAEWSPSGCNPNDPTWVSLRKNLGYALKFASRMNLNAVKPLGSLSSTGYALANPAANGAEYLVYAPSGGNITVDVSAARGQLTVEWFNPSTGITTTGAPVSGGGMLSFNPPFAGDAVLYLHQPLVLPYHSYLPAVRTPQ